ncbi:hypothetical protein [Hymenobacter chitinivorans]|uniref:Uncharacterized protein n=1 Tax=Hymenobacter chitinivorans DSM 11115 TaxID=1121954 RepID=A0A2M9B9L0_9BACT|nr:hypothetical protein [Hymenobacter chitinivorans]PJJ54616.1 hypothetical protein CLV45_2958 [Hymenobacter chitinivorans DSM 11115]
MAYPPAGRSRTTGTLYLLAGVLLLIALAFRSPDLFAAWQTGTLTSARTGLTLVFLVGALFMLRMGWRLRRTNRQNDVID